MRGGGRDGGKEGGGSKVDAREKETRKGQVSAGAWQRRRQRGSEVSEEEKSNLPPQ